MKITLKVRSLLILVALSALYTGCKKDDDDSKTLEQQQLEKLVFDWTLASAVDSQGDRTQDFTNLVLHLSGNYTGEGKIYNYSLTGLLPAGDKASPWPRSGTWKFGVDKSKDIIRDPEGTSEILMHYTVTETDLILTFEVPDGGGWTADGRIQNVTGEWTFTFTK